MHVCSASEEWRSVHSVAKRASPPLLLELATTYGYSQPVNCRSGSMWTPKCLGRRSVAFHDERAGLGYAPPAAAAVAAAAGAAAAAAASPPLLA